MSEENNQSSPLNELQILRLKQMAKFTSSLQNINWFKNIGKKLSNEEKSISLDYISAVGFPHSSIAIINSSEEASIIAENPDWNSEWWEAEEQLRASLLTKSLEIIDEEELNHALNHATAQSAEPALNAIKNNIISSHLSTDIDYQAFINAATGMAVASTYQAALVLASGEDENHPFTFKFRLIELGRLPIGIVGNTFSIY